jgi:hypothetical protein
MAFLPQRTLEEARGALERLFGRRRLEQGARVALYYLPDRVSGEDLTLIRDALDLLNLALAQADEAAVQGATSDLANIRLTVRRAVYAQSFAAKPRERIEDIDNYTVLLDQVMSRIDRTEPPSREVGQE